MNKIYSLLLVTLLLIGCASTNSDLVYGTPEWHAQEIENLGEAYKNGEITKQEYEEMKDSTDRILTKWNATKGVRAISY